MGQLMPDEARFDIPLVMSSPHGDAFDTRELVVLMPGEQSDMVSSLGCAWVQGQPGTWPDTTQLPQEEPDRDRSPSRQLVEESDEGCGIAAVTTDFTDVAVVSISDHLGERLETRGRPEVVPGVATGVEKSNQVVPFAFSSVGDPVDPGSRHEVEGPFSNPCRDAGAEQR